MPNRLRRVPVKETFQDRLQEEIRTFRDAAAVLPPGMQRELLLQRARQAESTLRMNALLRPTAGSRAIEN
jgi:hypothetical protein